MVYGAIIEKGEDCYSRLGKLFRSINNAQTEYNWLITDCECCPSSQELNDLFSQQFCWLSGEELTAIACKEDFQWIWGVLSGFKKDIPLEEVLKYPLPYADGYRGFWKTPLTMQHPLASLEIVAWDSSATLIFSKQRDLIQSQSFRDSFPFSEDLALYNHRIKR